MEAKELQQLLLIKKRRNGRHRAVLGLNQFYHPSRHMLKGSPPLGLGMLLDQSPFLLPETNLLAHNPLNLLALQLGVHLLWKEMSVVLILISIHRILEAQKPYFLLNYCKPFSFKQMVLLSVCAQSLSCVQLSVIQRTHQAPLSTGFSKQEYQRRLPFPSPFVSKMVFKTSWIAYESAAYPFYVSPKILYF